jgi:hypothetical protein
MLVKCDEHLHSLVRLERNFDNHNVFYQDYSLDIFQQTVQAQVN